MIVVDASVAVKWYAAESDSDAANALVLGPEQLLAPALIRVEVAAALIEKERRGILGGDEARRALALWEEAWRDGMVLLSSDAADLAAAGDLAMGLGHPLQDCLYLALALRLRVALVTADRRFAARARGRHAAIRMLDASSSASR